MSRNSLGSFTFMFYPVIMMSTYMLDETKHYSTFPFSLFLILSFLSSSFFFLFPFSFVVIEIHQEMPSISLEGQKSSFSSYVSVSPYLLARFYFIEKQTRDYSHYRQQQISIENPPSRISCISSNNRYYNELNNFIQLLYLFILESQDISLECLIDSYV